LAKVDRGKGARRLSTRLILGTLIWSFVTLAATGIVLAALFDLALERQLDARLATLSEALVAIADIDEAGELIITDDVAEPRYRQPYSGWYWQMDHRSQRIRSRSLWDSELPVTTIEDDMAQSLSKTVVGPDGRTLFAFPSRAPQPSSALLATSASYNRSVRGLLGL
jgi:hypothetical protein